MTTGSSQLALTGSPKQHRWIGGPDYEALSYQAVETPKRVQTHVSVLLDKLGLRFGALDFVVAPDGEWWFLECNPNGQWAWIEDETGMLISAALADALEGILKRDGT